MKKTHTLLLPLFLCAVAGLDAQTLGVDKNPLNFSVQFGGPAVSQTLNVTGSGTFTTFVDASWLRVNPVNGSAPSALTVTADPTGLAPGTYGATLSIFGTNRVDVRVNLAVSTISASPASLQFAFQAGANPPGTQTITLTGPTTTYNATATTSGGGSWLLLSTTGIVAGTTISGTSPGTITVSVNANVLAGLTAGTYNGTITITPTSGTGGSPISIPVTLTVSAAPPITITPSSVSLAFQIGGSNNSAQQTVTLASTGTQPVAYTLGLAVANNPAGRVWFTVAPSASGSIPANGSTQFTVGYDTTANLPAGTYTGTITVSTPGGAPTQQEIPVRLVVATSPLLSLSTNTLNFTYQVGTSGNPSAQNVTINSTSGALPLTLAAATANNSGNWLSVPATATAGTPFAVNVNPTGLAPGNYTGTITVTAAGAANSPQQITVNLKVTNDPVIVVSANGCSTASFACGLVFASQTGQAPAPSQLIRVTSSTGAALNYTAAAASTQCGNNWLLVSGGTAGTTEGVFSAAVNTAGIAAGSKCEGTITINATNPAAGSGTGAAVPNSPLTIPVTLYVSSTPLLVFSPSALTFNGQLNGSTPPQQTIILASTSSTEAVNYTVTVATENNANWLFVSPQSGSAGPAGSVLTVLAFPGILSAGTYKGTITVTATGPGGAAVADSPVTIPVVFQVNAGTIAATPASLNFTQLAGGPAPAAQTISVTGTPNAINFTVTATTDKGGNWLTATTSATGTPGSIQVSVNGGSLEVGSYTGRVIVTAATPPGATGSPISIPVTLNVVGAQTLTASPNNVTFAYTVGAPAPANQTVALSSTGGAAQFTVRVDQGTGSWLTVTPTSGSTPANLTFAANPTGLAAGRYTATVTITSSAALNPTTVTVTLTVTNPVPPVVIAIRNAASYASGSGGQLGLSPGENVVIGGTMLGPETLTGLALNANGTVATTVADTQVLFDNIPAPIVYVSATQSSVMVPYEVAGRATTTIRVVYKGVASDPVVYNVVPAVPGIYTQNAQGTGPGSILNQNNTVNGPSIPAARGTVVAIYMTGEGVTSPASTTGAVASTPGNPLTKPVLPVTATVGGIPATVEYFGSAPSLIYGVMQVNVRIPDNAPSGALPIVINVGNNPTQTGVTVSVQ